MANSKTKEPRFMVIPLDSGESSSRPDAAAGAARAARGPEKSESQPSPQLVQELVLRLRLVVSVHGVAEVEREAK